MRRSHLSLLLAALAVTASAGCGGGATDTAAPEAAPASAPAPSAAAVQMSGQDRTWLRRIHAGGMAELQVARLAQSNAKSRKVKSLGETLLTERGRFDEELLRSAARFGVTLPSTLSKAHRKQAEELAGAAGRKFDRRFVAEMLKSHKNAIAVTRREITRGSAPEVVALAKTALPSLRSHLGMLRKAD
ncbi:DUF4142 domain-containing protein [Nonomuraea lactucae]|uniref:DUF4142 domain-containing protein n=1 Tax=Nonomuraea lactucae TaxID=2249762 RepID=UPI0013B399BA|nr:DUF4142 domain-containing protein [Nonomuraea lactucae]